MNESFIQEVAGTVVDTERVVTADGSVLHSVTLKLDGGGLCGPIWAAGARLEGYAPSDGDHLNIRVRISAAVGRDGNPRLKRTFAGFAVPETLAASEV